MIFEIFMVATGVAIAYKITAKKNEKIHINYSKTKSTTYEKAKENLRRAEEKKELERTKAEIPQYIEIDLSELFKPDKKKKEQYNQKRTFRPYTEEERKAYGQRQRELREKGAQYEAFIADHYRSLGYEVIEHGKIMGRRDAGIDIIAKNHREAIMIQCKNWNSNNKEKITHKEIGDFVGKVEFFIEKNPEYKQYEIKRIFTISEPILDQSAIATINNNREMVRYEHIPFV